MNFKLCSAVVAALVVSFGWSSDAVADPAAKPAVEAAMAGSEDVVPKQWLDKQTSVEEAEAGHVVEGVAFGAQNDRWQKLKASLQPGDQLWTYCSPFESFQAHAGRCGIAVVRNGRVVNELVTLMN